MIQLIRRTAMGGAIAGTLVSILVAGQADCAGPDCIREQALGIFGHAMAAAALGAALGSIAAFAKRRIDQRP